jgi:3-oxoacyl-[acyl-carrier protein] reductase
MQPTLKSWFRRRKLPWAALDILVNNAGITRDGLAMRMKDEDWRRSSTSTSPPGFRLCRAAMRGMMKKRWGRIVNITSVVGVTGNPGQANYVASKAGIIGITKSLAQELASRNVTVNCRGAGLHRHADDGRAERQAEGRHSRARSRRPLGSPDDIAAAVLYLASEEAGYVTGQTLHVNGGMAMI